MYKNFYNFSALPFEINPDPKFLWLGEKHKEGLSALRYGILANAGFLSLTGDVGTGKTTLVNALVNSLGNNVIVAKIPDPYLKVLDFFNFTANAFKMNTKFSTKGDFLSHLKNFLYKAHAANKKVLLIIEEAQRLSQPLLEEVRLLSNIEKQDRKLINILFAGQDEFNSKLKKNRALKQRVTISYHIQPLTEPETKAYMRHRLGTAGSGTGVFSPGAVHDVYAFSKGNPRLINVVCGLALLSGYTKETKIIHPQIIKDCAAEYNISDQKNADFIKDRITPAESIRQTIESTEPAAIVQINQEVSEKTRRRSGSRRAASFALILLLIFSCFFGYLYYRGEKNAFIAKLKPLLQQSFGWFTVAQPENLFPDRQHYKAAAAGSEMRILSDIAGQGQTSGFMPDNNENHQNEISRLQSRLADLKSERSAGEMQLSRLQSAYEALVLELKELKGTQERVAELESVIATKEQMLARFEQKLNELEKHLDQEKKSGQDTFSAKLASKDAVVAELQEKLAASKADQVKLESEIASNKEQMAHLQGEFSDLNAQKTIFENQLTLLKTRNDALVTEIEELKGSQQRLAALETGVEQRNQTLSDLENKLKDVEHALDQKTITNNNLKTQLSSKTAQVENLQQKLNNYQANYVKRESEIAGNKAEISHLKGRLSDLNTKQASAPIAPVVLKMPEKLPPEDDALKTEAEAPNPGALIDWVLKKKTE